MTVPTRTPRIAVVLPVYNGEAYLADAIQSVLNQTFRDFELVVIDDGSTDRTLEVVARFPDARVRVIRFPTHRGMVAALNTGIRESKSELIARMDADDICLPRRFEKQVAFLETHSDVSICGTWIRLFGAQTALLRLPVEPEYIRARLFFGWAMGHVTIVMRRSFLEQHGLVYNDEFRHVEDIDFLGRSAELTRLANLPESLMLVRMHERSVSRMFRQKQRETEGRLIARQLRPLLPDVTPEEEAFHVGLILGPVEASSLGQAEQWLLRLDRANRDRGMYDVRAFQRELRRRWHEAHNWASSAGLRVLGSYWKSPLASIGAVGFLDHAGLISRCLIRSPSKRRQFRQFAERLRVWK